MQGHFLLKYWHVCLHYHGQSPQKIWQIPSGKIYGICVSSVWILQDARILMMPCTVQPFPMEILKLDSKYGKDMDRYEEYSKAVPAILVAAFTLSFVTKLNLQENMHLIDYVIASEWVQPQWLKFLFALLYNLSILFYRNKQVEEEQGFVRNGHADKWERVHQIRDKFEYDRERICAKRWLLLLRYSLQNQRYSMLP